MFIRSSWWRRTLTAYTGRTYSCTPRFHFFFCNHVILRKILLWIYNIIFYLFCSCNLIRSPINVHWYIAKFKPFKLINMIISFILIWHSSSRFGAIFNMARLVLDDFRGGFEKGPWWQRLFNGYSITTWLVVLNLGCTGLLVSWLMKHADNIVKVSSF